MRLQLPADSPDTAQGRQARASAMLTRIVAGQYDPLVWLVFDITTPQHTLKVRKLAQGLRMDGVRVVGGSFTCQQMCDALRLILPTPKLADLGYLATLAQGVSVVPSPDPRGSLQTTQSWEDHSDRVDALVVAAGGDPLSAAYQYGKIWALDNDAPAGKATNYCWYLPPPSPSSWEGVGLVQCVTYATTKLRCIQTNRGWIHTVAEDECDYSQMFDAFDLTCMLDGVGMSLADVATSSDATINSLVSHQGALRFTRQPGVPLFTGGAPTVAPSSADVWLPLQRRAGSASAAPALLNAKPYAGAPPPNVVAWAAGFASAYAPGTIIRDTVDGALVVARVEADGSVTLLQGTA